MAAPRRGAGDPERGGQRDGGGDERRARAQVSGRGSRAVRRRAEGMNDVPSGADKVRCGGHRLERAPRLPSVAPAVALRQGALARRDPAPRQVLHHPRWVPPHHGSGGDAHGAGGSPGASAARTTLRPCARSPPASGLRRHRLPGAPHRRGRVHRGGPGPAGAARRPRRDCLRGDVERPGPARHRRARRGPGGDSTDGGTPAARGLAPRRPPADRVVDGTGRRGPRAQLRGPAGAPQRLAW